MARLGGLRSDRPWVAISIHDFYRCGPNNGRQGHRHHKSFLRRGRERGDCVRRATSPTAGTLFALIGEQDEYSTFGKGAHGYGTDGIGNHISFPKDHTFSEGTPRASRISQFILKKRAQGPVLKALR